MPQMSLTAMARRRKAQQKAKQLYAHASHHGGKKTRKSRKNHKKNKNTRKTRKNKRKSSRRHH
jgi:hypothetical protein